MGETRLLVEHSPCARHLTPAAHCGPTVSPRDSPAVACPQGSHWPEPAQRAGGSPGSVRLCVCVPKAPFGTRPPSPLFPRDPFLWENPALARPLIIPSMKSALVCLLRCWEGPRSPLALCPRPQPPGFPNLGWPSPTPCSPPPLPGPLLRRPGEVTPVQHNRAGGCLSAEEGDWSGGERRGPAITGFTMGRWQGGPCNGSCCCAGDRGEGQRARRGLGWEGARPGRRTLTVHSGCDYGLCTHYVSGAGVNTKDTAEMEPGRPGSDGARCCP